MYTNSTSSCHIILGNALLSSQRQRYRHLTDVESRATHTAWIIHNMARVTAHTELPHIGAAFSTAFH